MADINTLIAGQRPPNILGQFVGGVQAGQQIGAASQQREQQNRLNQLLQGGAGPQQLAEGGFVDQASKLLGVRKGLAENERNEFDSGIRTLAAFTEGVTDAADPRFTQGLQAARAAGVPGIDDDDIQQALQLGPQVIQRLAKGVGQTDLSNVQSSENFPGGLTKIVTKGGGIEIRRLSPEDEKTVKAAERRGAELQGLRAGERKEAEKSAKISEKAFEQVGNIRANITNLEEVVRLVGEGAETGPLAKRLPSFRQASVELDNTRNRLGLDVIGSVTFGALSKGELDLALDTAIPTGLEGPALVQWANQKIDAQRKLAAYFDEQARFLGVPGNKVVDFLEQKRLETPTQPAAQQQAPAGAQQIGRFTVQPL